MEATLPPPQPGSRYVLHGLLADAARTQPEREAVRYRDRSITYGELEAASNGLAHALIRGGVQRGDRVGMFLPKGVEAVIALYGIMKAGAAYVPLDPVGPAARAGLIATDCTIKALVTTPSKGEELLRDNMPGHAPDFVVMVDSSSGPVPPGHRGFSFEEAISRPDPGDPGVSVIDQDLAYILYTSGSTGIPKGVMLTHRNALTFVEWCAGAIGVGPEDRVSNHAPLHFDLSVFDLYLAALGAATLVIVPEEEAYFGSSLVELIRKERITVWYSVPSALMLATRAVSGPGLLPSLRAVVFAGEVYPTKHLRELRRLIPRADLWNLYGPTETNVVTYQRVDDLPDDDRAIPIGRACENTDVFGVKEDGTPAGVGEEGELFVRGSTVMRGYWNRPDRTAEVLVPNPLGGSTPDLVYRTGDLARLRSDGGYDFLGRRDHQIKSRGYRIELGEIEAALSTHPALAAGVAVAVPHEEWGKAVVALVVPRDGLAVNESEVRRHVARRLPRYMVPWQVRVVEDLPRTSTGKVDRQTVAELVMSGTSVLR